TMLLSPCTRTAASHILRVITVCSEVPPRRMANSAFSVKRLPSISDLVTVVLTASTHDPPTTSAACTWHSGACRSMHTTLPLYVRRWHDDMLTLAVDVTYSASPS